VRELTLSSTPQRLNAWPDQLKSRRSQAATIRMRAFRMHECCGPARFVLRSMTAPALPPSGRFRATDLNCASHKLETVPARFTAGLLGAGATVSASPPSNLCYEFMVLIAIPRFGDTCRRQVVGRVGSTLRTTGRSAVLKRHSASQRLRLFTVAGWTRGPGHIADVQEQCKAQS